VFSKMSKQAVAPTQFCIQWILGVLSAGVKWPVGEDCHSPPSSAEVKKEWNYTSPPSMLLCGVNRNITTFYLTLSFRN
jgi:uncharacterized membrane protein YagU involved in acid resistance